MRAVTGVELLPEPDGGVPAGGGDGDGAQPSSDTAGTAHSAAGPTTTPAPAPLAIEIEVTSLPAPQSRTSTNEFMHNLDLAVDLDSTDFINERASLGSWDVSLQADDHR